MKRLTMYIDSHVFYSDNGEPILPIEMLDTPLVRDVLKKLAEYEDIGLEPNEIKHKLNEIDVLKWRVKYLKQFQPKESESLISVGNLCEPNPMQELIKKASEDYIKNKLG